MRIFYCFWLKKPKGNSHALRRQLYAYAANESTLRLRTNQWCRSSVHTYFINYFSAVNSDYFSQRRKMPAHILAKRSHFPVLLKCKFIFSGCNKSIHHWLIAYLVRVPQSRTQSPQASWSAGGARRDSWIMGLLPQESCGWRFLVLLQWTAQNSQSKKSYFFHYASVSPGAARWPRSLRTLGTRLRLPRMRCK